MSRVFKGFRAFGAPGLAIAGNASMRGVGTKMGTVFGARAPRAVATSRNHTPMIVRRYGFLHD